MKNGVCAFHQGIVSVILGVSLATGAEDDEAGALQRFLPEDVFEIEFASDPQISPDGTRIVYVRNFMDKMTDRVRSSLWTVSTGEGADHRPVTDGDGNDYAPRWSPDGKRLLYASTPPSGKGASQIYVRWMETGETARVSGVAHAPKSMRWSPDGEWIAFTMHVPAVVEPFVKPPKKPEGATWAKPPVVIEKMIYRADGRGYLKDGFDQLFVLPADAGTPRQLTAGPYHVTGAPSWTPDANTILFSSNRRDGWEFEPENSEIYAVSVADGEVRTLTDRKGPDADPAVSPDGALVAFTGFDDRYQGFQTNQLYVMAADGSNRRALTGADGPHVSGTPAWDPRGGALYVQHDVAGQTFVAKVTLDGAIDRDVVSAVGGTTLGRPYPSGSYSVSQTGRIAYTQVRPDRPADVAVDGRRITDLNADLFDHKTLGGIDEMWVESSHDGARVQAWIVKPPGFEAGKKYPMILEIHGGPFMNYGPRFAAEIQLFAAAGFVVVYANPRGSTSYGEEFANEIHHAYPGFDYDDLMSVVDGAVAKGFVDERNLFVTGGSGGGTLTAWIVGKTDRFRAAVSAKPVINWYSFALTADYYNFFYQYWFPGPPWEHPDEYLRRSPLSLVGNVTTPTMLLTGEVDYRTPISESEQFYQALKIRKVDTALVRFPEASHGIAARPSQLVAKAAHILKWFERYLLE